MHDTIYCSQKRFNPFCFIHTGDTISSGPSYRVYISQLIRSSKCFSHYNDLDIFINFLNFMMTLDIVINLAGEPDEFVSEYSVPRIITQYYHLTNWLMFLCGQIQSPRPDVMPDQREGIARAEGFVSAHIETSAS